MTPSDRSLEAVVAAVLAVNRYPLEKAWELLPPLRKAGLTRPEKVIGTDIGVLTVALAKAGYNRGLLTEMMAGRLQALMAAVQAGTLDRLDALVAAAKRDEAVASLREVRGIGPQVAANALALLEG